MEITGEMLDVTFDRLGVDAVLAAVENRIVDAMRERGRYLSSYDVKLVKAYLEHMTAEASMAHRDEPDADARGFDVVDKIKDSAGILADVLGIRQDDAALADACASIGALCVTTAKTSREVTFAVYGYLEGVLHERGGR